MSINTKLLNQVMVEKTIWWSVEAVLPIGKFQVSEFFLRKLNIDPESDDCFLAQILPSSRISLQTNLQELLNSKETIKRFSTGFQVADKVIWLANEVHLVHSEDGRSYLLAHCIDSTEMHEIEQNLVSSQSEMLVQQFKAKEAQSQKEKEILEAQYRKQTKFLAMLTHELRSPLQGVTGLIDLVKKRDSAGENIAEQLKIMKITLNQINFLINDILTYSQTQNEQLKLNPTTFSIKELADYVSHLTKSMATEKGVFVSVKVISLQDRFYGDLVRISQVLINLVVNAIKFTQVGGVNVVLEEREEALILTVSDSGEGIGEKELETMFIPFNQLDSLGSQQHVGSGLGLPVVKTLVELLGGEINVVSTLEIGTTFIAKIPVTKGKNIKENEASFVLSSSTFEPAEPLLKSQGEVKILIADDSEVNRVVLEMLLLNLHCTVDKAEDGEQAYQLFEQNDYDFIFLDIQMPELNGAEVCQKIRNYRGKHKPLLKGVFALTAAHTMEEVSEMGIEVDKSIFNEWIEKPISEDKVMTVLHQYCTRCFKRQDATSVVKISLTNFPIPDSLQSLKPKFIEALRASIDKLKQSKTRMAIKPLKEELHSLKGNLMLFAQEDLVQKIKEIEGKGLKEDPSNLIYEIDILIKLLKERLSELE